MARKPKTADVGAKPRRPLRTVLKWGLLLAIWSALGAGGVVAWYGWDLPAIDRLESQTRRPSITLLDADGAVIARRGDLYGKPVRFKDLPPYLVQAVVATEDRRFFEHPGVDVIGIMRAAWANLRAGRVRQGGSTITQQVAKNLFLTPVRTIRRKVREALLALWLEARFTKRQIFTIYINRVYFGAGTFGVGAASRRYFGIDAARLTLHQAALLAGLLKAPSRFSPARSIRAAKARAAQVLANMVQAGFLEQRHARAARRQPIRVRRAQRKAGGHYFTDWLIARARGFVGGTPRDLVIATTLDAGLQRAAQTRLTAMLDGPGRKSGVSQAALVALTASGAVRAMVGGRSYRESQFNRATQARRQPGSAFKPIVYLAALEAGMSPDDRILDGPLNIKGWRPKNYDGKYRGPISLSEALAQSINTVAVRVSERVGRGRVIAAAERLGITTPLPSHPSVALGAGEVTLIELTAAYGVFANRGRTVWPFGIAEVRDGAGKLLWRRTGSGAARVVAARDAARITAMLAGVVEAGTGRNARLARPAAGKTGTSQDFRDAWFIGFTADLIAGVWLGNDDGKPMKRVTGGGLPALLWRDFMTDAHRGLPVRALAAP